MSPSYRRLTEKDKGMIMRLRGLGHSTREIGERLGVSEQTISYHLNKFKEKAAGEGEENAFWDILVKAGLIGAAAAGITALLLYISEKNKQNSNQT